MSFSIRSLCAVPLEAMLGRVHCDNESYRLPPREIQALADANPIPQVTIQPRSHSKVLYMHYSTALNLEDLSAPVLKLAGARFNPCTLCSHGPSAPSLYYTGLEMQDVDTEEKRWVSLPESPRMNHFRWSPDGSRMAFSLRITELGHNAIPKLWLLDLKGGTVAPVQPEQPVNAVLGSRS